MPSLKSRHHHQYPASRQIVLNFTCNRTQNNTSEQNSGEKKSIRNEETCFQLPVVFPSRFFIGQWISLSLGCTSCEMGIIMSSVSSVAQSCPTLCDAMDYITPGFPVHHPLLELVQTHVHRVTDAIEPSHPLSSPFPALNLSQHQHLFHISVWKYSVANTLKYYFFSSLLEIMQLSNLCIRS